MSEFIHQYVPANGSPLTLLLLHGTGGDENDLVPIGRTLAPGAALISPRGKVSEGGAARFFRRLSAGVFDEQDIRLRASELAEFVKGFGLGNVFALGYSNGANIAAALMLLHPEVLAGGILLRPMVPLTPEALPDLGGKPVMILAGEHDEMTRPEITKNLASLLTRAGAKVEVRWMDAGHDLGPGDFQGIKEFVGAR
ncbi:MAG: phospholipase/Carboxylesterase [Bryobacterales bacterium]|nr:phospholipase/Carboxylesterase [Bryobacterales bacterium]